MSIATKRRRLGLLVVSIVAVLAGGSMGIIGAHYTSHDARAAGQPSAAPQPAQTGPSGTAVSQMSVFTHPRQPTDNLTEAAKTAASYITAGTDGISQSLLPGTLDFSNSRLLLGSVGSPQLDIYGVPTDSGAACLVTIEGEGCVSTFAQQQAGVAWQVSGSPRRIYGLIPDDVAAVSVSVAGVLSAADVQNNAFFYQLTDGAWPDRLVVTMTDGSTETVDLPSSPPIPQSSG